MAKNVVLAIGGDLDDDTLQLCCRDIRKKTNGRFQLETRRINDARAINVTLNGHKAGEVIKDVLGKRCRHMNVKFT